MTDVENKNNFKLALIQGNVVLFEKIFDDNLITAHGRGYVDIRKILPSSINQLQKVLSKNMYNTKISVNSNKAVDGRKYYDLFFEYLKDLNSFPLIMRGELEYNPEAVTFKVNVNTGNGIESMTIKGVECKLTLYKNDTSIVERLFYVDRFNPISRWSTDLTNICESIFHNIFNSMKNSDISYLWSEYDKLVEYTDVLVID